MIATPQTSAQSIIAIATEQNQEPKSMPPWRAALLMGAIVIDVLVEILGELRIANRKRKPTE